MTALEFNPDERALLDYLNRRVKPDGAIAASDAEIIAALFPGDDRRYFSAKGRLQDGGVLETYIDVSGRRIIALNMPERTSLVSRRYVLQPVPLELVDEIRRRIKTWRLAELAKEAGPKRLPSPRQPNRATSNARALGRLGATAAAPLKPPLRLPGRPKPLGAAPAATSPPRLPAGTTPKP